MQTIYWHDYETFGANPQTDRPCQFAGVRTDLDLNIIKEPCSFYCTPPEDVLPAPQACIVTGITPQIALREGVAEAEFAHRIHHLFSVPDTCVAGYNSIRFDDEVSRNLFYRNFFDPYEREWKNGNSRWDLIDVVRLVYVMRPETLNWPKDERGCVSFRLELLTEANCISHASAHEAISDVYATIALAKLIKQRQPKLFEWAFSFRDKARVNDSFDLSSHKPVLHVSSKYSAANGCCAVVAPLFRHPLNKNGIVVWDLRSNPEHWFAVDPLEIKRLMYTSSSELLDGQQRPALKTVHLNKCPVVLPASSLKQLPDERKLEWNLDEQAIKRHLSCLRDNHEKWLSWSAVFEEGADRAISDPEQMIYSGGFFSHSDKQTMARIRSLNSEQLFDFECDFDDFRLSELLFRYKARNFPETLSDEEQDRWQKHCFNRIVKGESGYLNLEAFVSELNRLSKPGELSDRDRDILEELKCYAESIVPYG